MYWFTDDNLCIFPIKEEDIFKEKKNTKFKLPECQFPLKKENFPRHIIIKLEKFTREDILNNKIKLRESLEHENLDNKEQYEKQYKEQLSSLKLFIIQKEEKIQKVEKFDSMEELNIPQNI